MLHAKAGNALGDVAAYDYFSLGGPYSVRGYSHGEIGAARRFLELATEVRGRGRIVAVVVGRRESGGRAATRHRVVAPRDYDGSMTQAIAPLRTHRTSLTT